MTQLNDLVLETIRDVVKNNTLFTSLDVSNSVKNILPSARHLEIRDLVCSVFQTEIESAGYARTLINVTLSDGSCANALLYHPLADSWDLDDKYDAQKRMQSTTVPAKKTVSNTVLSTASALPTPQVTNPALSNKDIWNNLFQSQKSLFTNK